ncbi:MAG TPA: DUF3413 domain-containing protein [Steroidobacter sp.]
MTSCPSRLSRRPLLRWWGGFLFSTVLLEIAIALRYYAAADLDVSPPSMLFRAAMLVSHFTTLSALLLSPVPLLILLRVRASLAIPLAWLISVALLLGLLVDTQVFQLYRFHINAGVLNLLFGGAAAETFVFSGAMYARAALIAAGVAALQAISALLWWRRARSTPGRPLLRRVAVTGTVTAMLAFHLVHIWADVVAHEPILEQTSVLPLRYAATAKRSLRALGVNVRPRPLLAGLPDGDKGDLAYPLRPVRCEGSSERRNIVVILIDSWRFDALTAEVTPNLDALARRSVRFLDHHSGGNATRIGVFSLFYAIPGTYWHRMLMKRQGPVFVDKLLEQGYDVRVFRSAPLYSPEFDRTVFASLEGVRLRSDGRTSADRDRDLTGDFIEFLDSPASHRPFFALLFYDSPHKLDFPVTEGGPRLRPSAPDVDYFRLEPDTDPLPLLNRYRNSVHYVDSLVGEALEALERRKLLEESIILVTGDHGQEFNDNGRNYWGHGSNFTRYQTGVPLLVHAPDLAPALHTHRTTHFDVVPTLLERYFGCREPFYTYSVGRSLFEPGGRETLVLSEYADFAIVRPDRIAVVREQGMQVLGPNYAELAGASLEPEAIWSALEQKTRFYELRIATRRPGEL